ncbi:glycosyltransferase family 4 protein [Fenollaria sporofastidiosus]|uniref:glycosyltransferase family 4 protein n=1 Tax=Fenollaria sporofastidiosus TaxID=2811778 RepID=UPI001BFFEAFC|nr:glycosyltransferase family 4 protein [Fenollaria sporofastidiosus]
MRVLHVLTQLPAKTGSGVYFANLISAFKAAGAENAAIYGAEEKHRDLIDVNTDRTYEVLYDTEEVPFHICGMSDEMPYKSTIYSEMSEDEIDTMLEAFRKRLLKAKEEFKPELVISHHLMFLTDLVREVFPDVKVVGISHGTDMRQIMQHRRFLARLTHLKELDQVLTVTPAEHEQIEDILGITKEKIHLVGGAYNDKVFYPSTKAKSDKTIRLMFAGKITESKGVFALAAALPYLEKNHDNIELHIIGNASKDDKERMMIEAKRSKNLYIRDAENQMLMAEDLRRSDIFILPSYFEALGLVAIEALACHKLVVASEIDGLKMLLGEKLVHSGIIEFTELPRIYDVDKPYKEDVPSYVERLAAKIEKQIARLDENLFTEEISRDLHEYSWVNLGKRILSIIK